MKNNLKLSLGLISQYRNELMGISTLLIIICHAHGKLGLSNALDWILSTCNIGVEIFLFLSGLSIYYSLDKLVLPDNIFFWYRKRFIRLLLPLFLFGSIWWIPQILFYQVNLWQYFGYITTIGYWINHKAPWFIALLLPLYLISPLLYKFFSTKRFIRYFLSFFSSVIILIVCAYFYDGTIKNSIVYNICTAFCNSVSFLFGMSIAPDMKKSLVVKNYCFFILPIILFVLIRITAPNIFSLWLLLFPFVGFSIIILNYISNKFVHNILTFLGKISLESYIVNTAFGTILSTSFWKSNIIFLNNFIGYILINIIGLLVAYILHRICNRIENYK